MLVKTSFLEEIIKWDIANWSRALDFWEEQLSFAWSERTALEVGAKDGGLSLYLALRGCNVVCSDLDGPSPLARALHQKHGLGQRVQYRALDATDMDLPDNCFDIVAFKSVLGGIGWDGAVGRQRRAIEEMHRVLKPGGALLFAENLQGSPVHMWARRKFKAWGEAWRYLTIEELIEFTRCFSRFDWRAFGCLGAFGRSERQKSALGKIDIFADRMLPASMKYILFGCAIK